jgi:hypothetical protein
MSIPKLHTPQEVAEVWGHTADWWTKRARRGEVPHRVVGREVRFTDADLARILADAAVEPTAPDPTGLSPRSRAARRRARMNSAA